MKRLWLSLLTGSVVTLAGLTGCASDPSSSADMTGAAPERESAVAGNVAQTSTTSAQQSKTNSNKPPSEEEATQRTQLIKKAQLTLSVDSVEETIKQVREIVQEQNGDVLSLSNQRNGESSETDTYRALGYQQSATLFTLRVPQDRFDSAVDAIAEIGEVTNRAITTEDVSSQLVDLQARISNSQQSEAALKEIMSRSGDIADVLEVSRELSKVRQEIEQMKAAQKNLQTQVRFSTISVSLSSAIAQTPNQPAFTTQLANTWNSSTSSVGNFTTDLLQLGLWLLVYSPYIAILLGGAVVARKVLRSSASD